MHETTEELLDLFIQIKDRLVTEHGLGKWLIVEDDFVNCVKAAEEYKAQFNFSKMESKVREAADIANKYVYDPQKVWYHGRFLICPLTGKRRLPYF